MVDNSHTCDSPTEVLASLADPDCRAILVATAAEPRSVPELVSECEIPTATAYRKVKRLVDVGLLDERIEIRSEGKNVSRYTLRVEEVTVTIDDSDDLDRDWILEAGESAATRGSNDGEPIHERGVKTDGGREPAPVEGDKRRKLQEIFVEVTGTDVLVDEQDSTVPSRTIEDDANASVSEYVAAVATDDGLSDTIDEFDVGEVD